MDTSRGRLAVGVADAILVFGGTVALYVLDWGTTPDTPADRMVKAFTLFWVPTLVVLPPIAALVGWRAACDTKRFRKGLLNTLWRPIVEALGFGFCLGFVAVMAAAVIGEGGRDVIRPATLGEWLTFVLLAIRIAALLGGLAAVGAMFLAVVNRLLWRLTRGYSKQEHSA
jgi:hypothetical protein